FLCGFHDNVSCKVRTREGDSEPYFFDVGSREGCPSSLVLFNSFHAAVDVKECGGLRRERGSTGIRMGSLPGWQFNARVGGVPGARAAKKLDAHIAIFDLLLILFADDLNGLVRGPDRERAEQDIKTALGMWGEVANGKKLGRLCLGPGSSQQRPDLCERAARFIGAWLRDGGGREVDASERLEAAGRIWNKVYRQLPRLGLADKQIGRVLRATVEACLFWGCDAGKAPGSSGGQRIAEIVAYTDIPTPDWHARWADVAADAEGRRWRQVAGRWVKDHMAREHAAEWRRKHAADQMPRPARLPAEVPGAARFPSGKCECAHCGSHMGPRSIRSHVEPCALLPAE
ncbi:unnamed protein product, partial [Prorocentrum cordatum]